MSVKLPNGAFIYVAKDYEESVEVTAITNANPAVATAQNHGLKKGDYIELTSGWNKINESIFRVGEVTTTTFELEAVDTTDTNTYPTGSSGGSVRKIKEWAQIQQITETSTDGGEAQFVEYDFLEDDFQRRIPNGYSAMSINLTIADDPTLEGYKVLKKAKTLRDLRALRFRLPNSSEILYNGFVSLNETPTTTKGDIMTVSASLALSSEPKRY